MPRTILYNAVPLAVLLLALALVIAFHALPGYSAGLSVQVAPVRCDCFPVDRSIVLQVSNKELLINSDPVDQRNLASRLSDIYSPRLHRDLYLLVEDDVSFQQAAEVIDIVPHSKNLNIQLLLLTPGAMNPPCRENCYNLMETSLRGRCCQVPDHR